MRTWPLVAGLAALGLAGALFFRPILLDDPNSAQSKQAECAVVAAGAARYVDPILSGTPEVMPSFFRQTSASGSHAVDALVGRAVLYLLAVEAERRARLAPRPNDCTAAFRAEGLRPVPSAAERTKLALSGQSVTIVRHRRPIVGPAGWAVIQARTEVCEAGGVPPAPGDQSAHRLLMRPTLGASQLVHWDGGTWRVERSVPQVLEVILRPVAACE